MVEYAHSLLGILLKAYDLRQAALDAAPEPFDRGFLAGRRTALEAILTLGLGCAPDRYAEALRDMAPAGTVGLPEVDRG